MILTTSKKCDTLTLSWPLVSLNHDVRGLTFFARKPRALLCMNCCQQVGDKVYFVTAGQSHILCLWFSGLVTCGLICGVADVL